MANRNTQGFGLIPAGRMGGTPSIQGQGKYFIDAGHSTTTVSYTHLTLPTIAKV